MGLWKKIDCGLLVADSPFRLVEGDICYYAYDYLSGRKWDAGKGNDLIKNFQKPVSLRHSNQWQYKEWAVGVVGKMVAAALPDGTHVASMPTSKTDDHAEYDDRLIRALAVAKATRPSLIVHRPIGRSVSSESAKGGGSRDPHEIFQELSWLGFDGEPPKAIYLVDDVITTGGHYKACQMMLEKHSPGIEVGGLFCAKTMWPKDDDDSTTVPLPPPPPFVARA